MAEPVVVADQLVKRWGSTPVLMGATFTVGRGVTGLLGANGAGKTTLLGMLLGLHRPESGSQSGRTATSKTTRTRTPAR